MSDTRLEHLNIKQVFTALILAFWACWFCLVVSSNAVDFFTTLHLLHGWTFDSHNFAWIKESVAVYHTPHWMAVTFFLVDIVLQLACAILFVAATFEYISKGSMDQVKFPYAAFLLSLVLWMIFIIMEEVFVTFTVEAVHIRIMVAEMVSLILILLLDK